MLSTYCVTLGTATKLAYIRPIVSSYVCIVKEKYLALAIDPYDRFALIDLDIYGYAVTEAFQGMLSCLKKDRVFVSTRRST